MKFVDSLETGTAITLGHYFMARSEFWRPNIFFSAVVIFFSETRCVIGAVLSYVFIDTSNNPRPLLRKQ